MASWGTHWVRAQQAVGQVDTSEPGRLVPSCGRPTRRATQVPEVRPKCWPWSRPHAARRMRGPRGAPAAGGAGGGQEAVRWRGQGGSLEARALASHRLRSRTDGEGGWRGPCCQRGGGRGSEVSTPHSRPGGAALSTDSGSWLPDSRGAPRGPAWPPEPLWLPSPRRPSAAPPSTATRMAAALPRHHPLRVCEQRAAGDTESGGPGLTRLETPQQKH